MSLLLWDILTVLFSPFLFLAAALSPKNKSYLIWGSDPLIGNKYWSEALKEKGFKSITIMSGVYMINRREDFDKYFEDFLPSYLPGKVRLVIGAFFALFFVLRHAAVIHIPYNGFALKYSRFWRLESLLFKIANVKVVISTYGGDGYIYSRIIDTSLRYGLLASYPELARRERKIVRRVDHWNEKADVVLVGLMVDGLGRWDVTTNQTYCIDTGYWKQKEYYSEADGRQGEVIVLHTPNHRGFKGTEFLVEAVDRLVSEGLKIKLVLLEKVPNEKVRDLMATADILAEQFIASGYATSGIEGMATGLPVLANLDHPAYTQVYRRYGFLGECPVLSTAPETIYQNLRILVTQPQLRQTLGKAGRMYVDKYHSYKTAQYLFGSIYDKILHNKSVELINLFHPLTSVYSKSTPRVVHPLKENKIPDNYSYQ